ncbi:MAG: hypothetical protein ACYTF6_02265 [Planctomycetota bacterium]|jgi:Spy/CpxP family protein refolding chaperone
MKRLIVPTLCVMASVALVSSLILAESEPPAGEATAEKGQQKAHAARHHGKEPLERLASELKLTEEQQKQVSEILQTHRQAVENWQKENGPKLKELHEQMRKVLETRKELVEGLHKQLAEVLTDEQVEKAKKILRRRHPRAPGVMRRPGAMWRLDLTEEQKEAAKKIMQEAKEAAKKAEGREAKAKIFRDAHEKIISSVLTDQQREKMKEMRKAPRDRLFKWLDLTAEQRTQAEAVMKKAFEEAKKAESAEAKREIIRNARKKVFDEVLTEQQRKKIKDRMGKMRRHGPRCHKGKAEGSAEKEE